MTDFTEDMLCNLEKMAHIECEKNEEALLTDSLKKILDYVEQLSEVSTEDTPIFSHQMFLQAKNASPQPLRKDEPGYLLPTETYLENVPERTAGMIRVPPVLQPKEKNG